MDIKFFPKPKNLASRHLRVNFQIPFRIVSESGSAVLCKSTITIFQLLKSTPSYLSKVLS